MSKIRFPNWKRPDIKHGIPTKYGWTVYYPECLFLGQYTDIGWGTFIQAQYGVTIEDNVQIGPFCAILSANTINGVYGEILIKEGAKIGAYTLILPGAIVEENQFVKARSILK